MVRVRGVFTYIIITFLMFGGILFNFRNALAADEFMSWGIEAMGLDKAISVIEEKGDAEHLLVAVIDTGVNEALFREYFPDRNLSGYCIVACPDGMVDNVNHGTHVISTIAEGTPSNVDLLMIRVSEGRTFTIGDLRAAMDYAVSQGANVILVSAGMSLDFDDETAFNEEYTWGEINNMIWEAMQGKVDEAVDAGAIVVSVAGDNGANEVFYPASYDNAISVGAVSEGLSIADFSNYNEYVDYVAPGMRIRGLNASYGAEGQDITTLDQGTSSAAAHVVAAIANILSFNKNLTLDEMRALLNSKAVDLGEEGRDDYYGNGFIDFSEVEFCTEEVECDEYGVFALIPDEPEPDEEEDVPVVPNTGDGGINAPDTGYVTKPEEGGATMVLLAGWQIYVLVGVGLWWVRKKPFVV
ncbi:S8 family serine peptidase [Candidatus Saccharibacteria bacterium]|nr:S8 family serine peptidase [Candidatus Saccharibacteria bacterium]